MKNIKQTQVFTPEWVTNEMLDLLKEGDLSDDDTYFFEPCCGDGAMLTVIIKRIFSSLKDKYAGFTDGKERAFAETLVKFYAIELDPRLVVDCRINVFMLMVDIINIYSLDIKISLEYVIARVLQDKIENKDFFEMFKKYKKAK